MNWPEYIRYSIKIKEIGKVPDGKCTAHVVKQSVHQHVMKMIKRSSTQKRHKQEKENLNKFVNKSGNSKHRNKKDNDDLIISWMKHRIQLISDKKKRIFVLFLGIPCNYCRISQNFHKLISLRIRWSWWSVYVEFLCVLCVLT